MRRGGLAGGIGLVASVLGILGFLGVQNYQDLAKPARATATTSVARPAPTEDPGRDKWDYIHLADRACGVATARTGEITKYANSAKLFPKWARKVDELRADLLRRWRETEGSLVDGVFADETGKIWADYASANWYWSVLTKQIAAGHDDQARESFETFKKYDDSALRRANELGYSACNYAWPRPISW